MMSDFQNTNTDNGTLTSQIRNLCDHGDAKALEILLLKNPLHAEDTANTPGATSDYAECLIHAARFAGSANGTPRMLNKQSSRMLDTLLKSGFTFAGVEKKLLGYTLSLGNEEAVEVLKRHEFPFVRWGNACGDLAVISATPKVFKILKSLEINANGRDDFYETPFLKLCANRIVFQLDEPWHLTTNRVLWYLEKLETLIDAGVDINATDRLGASGLIRTLVAGNFVLARALIMAGANINVRLRNGVTTSHIAATCAPRDFLRFYLEQGPPYSELQQLDCKRIQPDSKSIIQNYVRKHSNEKIKPPQ